MKKDSGRYAQPSLILNLAKFYTEVSPKSEQNACHPPFLVILEAGIFQSKKDSKLSNMPAVTLNGATLTKGSATVTYISNAAITNVQLAGQTLTAGGSLSSSSIQTITYVSKAPITEVQLAGQTLTAGGSITVSSTPLSGQTDQQNTISTPSTTIDPSTSTTTTSSATLELPQITEAISISPFENPLTSPISNIPPSTFSTRVSPASNSQTIPSTPHPPSSSQRKTEVPIIVTCTIGFALLCGILFLLYRRRRKILAREEVTGVKVHELITSGNIHEKDGAGIYEKDGQSISGREVHELES